MTGNMAKYRQLNDGRWQQEEVAEKFLPQEIKVWYMRDNHTFRPLPINVELAVAVLRDEFSRGQTYGMLCGSPMGVVPCPLHATGGEKIEEFIDAARKWLSTIERLSTPPARRRLVRGKAVSGL